MKRPILTQQQIDHAKKLKEQGKTKRELASIFNVGATTIWENVFRQKVYYPSYQPRCLECEIVLTREIPGTFIPLNFKIGKICIGCYLKQKGIKYIELIEK